MPDKVTVPALRARKATRGQGARLAMVTAYDATFARLLDGAGLDAILVGDSLGMVIQGGASTLAVTLDEMVYHCRAVARGTRRAHLIGDMPFLSYQVSPEDALRSAGRLMKEGGAESVKLEGGRELADTVQRLVRAGIPVVGHVGLMPQRMHAMGGFKVQGREREDAENIVRDAVAIAEAGAFCVVLEGVPAELAARITATIAVPTVGIGAGADCDGQILVCYDLLGLNDQHTPRFVKRYDEFFARGQSAAARYVEEVRGGAFPAAEHSFGARVPRAPQDEPSRVESAVDAANPLTEAQAYGPLH